MQRRYIYGRRSRARITEPGPGQWHIAPAVTRPVRTAPGAPSHADGLRKKSRTVTAGQGCPRRRSEARIGTARKYAPAARDYALFRTLYHAGIRCEEAVLLDVPDVHFGRGPFGKLHVRFGKAARTSGPRPRWVPMLDGLDLQLRWFLEEIRPRLGDGPALFCDEGGGR